MLTTRRSSRTPVGRFAAWRYDSASTACPARVRSARATAYDIEFNASRR